MKHYRLVVSLILVAMLVVAVLPVASLNQGDGVYAATASEIVDDANSWVTHTPYKWGGTSLIKGCDCSGFVCAIFKRHGLDLIGTYGIRSGYDMQQNYSKFGKNVGTSTKKIKDGYIIIFNYGDHVGIGAHDANGNKEIIHAANSARGTQRDSITYITGSQKITAIIKPNIINGKTYSNVTRDSSKDTNTDDKKEDDTGDGGEDNQGDQEEEKQVEEASKNPGYPYAIPTAKIQSGDYAGGKWIQAALNKVCSAGLEVDGVIGPITKKAIKSFQKSYGIKANGSPNKKTINKLVNVFVLSNSITKLKMKKVATSIQVGDTLQMQVAVSPSKAQSIALKWESSRKRIATVNSSGLVTAVSKGSVMISATSPNGKTVKKKITVTECTRRSEWANGKWYDSDGKTTNEYRAKWTKVGKNWSYGNDNGWQAKNQWLKIDGYWYYFKSDGYIYKKTWAKIGGYWYYFKKKGSMACEEYIKGYWISADGTWTYKYKASWKKLDGRWIYKDTSGYKLKSTTVKIDGKNYTFDKDGFCTNK